LNPTHCPLQQPHVGGLVRDKHVSGSMGNGERDLALHKYSLRRHATGVKDWNFSLLHVNGIAPIWFGNILNANRGGATDADGSTVGVSVLGGNLDFLGDLNCWNRLHTDYHVAMQTSSWITGNIGLVHGHVLASFGGTQWNASVLQCTVVRKRATNEKGNRILGPVFRTVRHFFLQRAIPVNGISVQQGKRSYVVCLVRAKFNSIRTNKIKTYTTNLLWNIRSQIRPIGQVFR